MNHLTWCIERVSEEYKDQHTDPLIEALKEVKPLLEYFNAGLSDVAEGSGEVQPMHQEVKQVLSRIETTLLNAKI